MKLHIGLLTVIASSLSCLEAARFPLTFRLCAYRLDGSNERFESVGYQDEERMFLGQSRFDDSKFGWSGHGVNMGVAEMLAATNFDWASLITKVEYQDGKEGTEAYLRPILQQKIHGCITFDPNDYFSMVAGGELFITVNKTENLGLSVYMEDWELTVSRTLKSTSTAYSGAKVSLADLGQTWNKKFLLSLSQRQAVERSSDCVNYPSQQFSSYRQCDDAFLSQVCQSLNITPFWATTDLSEVTRDTANPGPERRLELWNLFDGSLESDCARPCLATNIRGAELAEWRTNNQHSTLAFSFSQHHQSSSPHCFS